MTLYLKAALVFAQIKLDTPADIIGNTKEISSAIDEGIAAVWLFLKSPLFIAVSEVGAVIAGLGAAFYIIKWVKEVAKSDEFFYPDKIPQIACGLMLAVLLGAPTERGKLLADVLVSYDRFSTNLSNTVLVAARIDPTEDPIFNAQVRQAVIDRVAQDEVDCARFPLVSPERTSCIAEAIERMQASLDPFKDQEWAKRTEDGLVRYLSGLTNDATGQRGTAELRRTKQALTALLEDGLTKSLIGFTFGIAVAWLLLLRIAKPLISIVSPLYIGLSYVPSSKPPVLWAIGLLIDVVLVEIVGLDQKWVTLQERSR